MLTITLTDGERRMLANCPPSSDGFNEMVRQSFDGPTINLNGDQIINVQDETFCSTEGQSIQQKWADEICKFLRENVK